MKKIKKTLFAAAALLMTLSVSAYAAVIDNVVATDGSVPGSVTINWNKPSDSLCTSNYGCGYQVFRNGTLVYSSKVDVDGMAFDSVTSFTDYPSNSSSYTYVVKAYPDTKSGAGSVFGTQIDDGSTDVGYAGLMISNFRASSLPGAVQLDWNNTGYSCQSINGCGFVIYRDGTTEIFRSKIDTNTYSMDTTSQFIDLVSDTAIHSYKIAVFRDGTSGAGTTVGAKVSEDSVTSGSANASIEKFAASDGGYAGSVKLTWSPIEMPCMSTAGCGYEIKMDGVLQYRSNPTTFASGTPEPGKVFVGTNSYTVYLNDTGPHTFQIQLYSLTRISAMSASMTYIGSTESDTGFAGETIKNFSASDGSAGAIVVKMDAFTNTTLPCPSQYGCGYEIFKEGVSVYKSLAIIGDNTTYGNVWVGSAQYIDFVADSATVNYSAKVYYKTFSSGAGYTAKYIGAEAFDTGYASPLLNTFSASKGDSPTDVYLNWTNAGCSNQQGCGVQIYRDGSLIYTSTKSTSGYSFINGASFVTSDAYTDKPEQGSHEYKIRSFFWDGSTNPAKIGQYVGGAQFDSGYTSESNVSDINLLASDGIASGIVTLTWNQQSGVGEFRIFEKTDEGEILIDTVSGSHTSYSHVVDDTNMRRYFIRMYNGETQYGKDTITDTGYALPGIKSFVATDGTQLGQIYISWNLVNDASEYELFEVDGNGATSIYKGAGLNFTHVVSDTSLHLYQVRAINNGKYFAVPSKKESGFAKIGIDSVSATDGTFPGKVYVDWQMLSNVPKYQVLRDGVTIGTVTYNPYVDSTLTDLKQHVYAIRALNSQGNQMGMNLTSDLGYAGSVFKSIDATQGTVRNGVRVEWSDVSGAASYKIYRIDNSSTATTFTSTTKTYLDTAVLGTNKYSYQVGAFSSTGTQIGALSPIVVGFAGNDANAPKNLKASDGTSLTSINLSWDAVQLCVAAETTCNYATQTPANSGQTLGYYAIYKDGVLVETISSSSTDYVVSGLDPGKSFTFAVEALDTSKNVIASRSGVDIGSTMQKLAAPKNIVASDGWLVGKISVTWERVKNAESYVIYRDNVQIGTASVYQTSFTDSSVVPVQSYSYTVAAVGSGITFDKGTADTGFAMVTSVTNVKATDGTVTDGVKITFDKRDGATSYTIRRDGVFIKTLLSSIGYDEATNTYSYVDSTMDKTKVIVYSYTVYPMIGGTTGPISASDSGYINKAPTSIKASGTAVSGALLTMTPTIADMNKNEVFTLSVIDDAGHGTGSITGGKIGYQSEPGYSGPDTFYVKVTDKAGASATGPVTVKVICGKVNATFGNQIPTDIRAYDAGSVDLTLDNAGCTATYNVSYEIQKRSGATWSTLKTVNLNSVAGGSTLKIPFDGLEPGSYQIKLSATDLYAEGAPVSDGYAFTVRPYTLPTITLNKDTVFQSVDEVTASIIESNDCKLTTDGTVASASRGKYCLLENIKVPTGISLDPQNLASLTVKGYIDNVGKQTFSADVSVFSEGNQKIQIGTVTKDITAVSLDSMVFNSPSKINYVQFLEKINFAVGKSSDGACDVTTSVESAMNSYGENKFRCLLEFNSLPAELELSPNGFKGNLSVTGSSSIGWTLSYYRRGTDKALVRTGSVELVGTPADIQYELDSLKTNPLQYITKVDLGLNKAGSSVCALTAINDDDARGKCFVEWTQVPNGLSQSSDSSLPKLTGFFKNSGTNTVKYAVSFINRLGVKYPVYEGTASYTVDEIPLPKVTFAYGNIITDSILGYPKGGGIASRLVVDGSRTPIDGEVTFSENASNDFKFSVNGKNSRVILVRPHPIWSEQSATVKLWLKENATLADQKTVTLVAIPESRVKPELMLVESRVSDSGPLQVKMRIGEYRRGGFFYVPEEMGTWKLRLLTRVNGTFIPASDFVDVNSSGEAVVNYPVIGLSSVRFMVEAVTQSPTNSAVVINRLSRYRDILIVKGRPIDGQLTIKSDKPSSGPAPFNVRFEVKLDGKSDFVALGDMKYEISKDGEDWMENDDKKCKLLCSIIFYQGKYQVRARFTNKNSGAVSYTQPMDIYSYDGIKVKFEGKNVLYPREQVELAIKTINANGEDVNSEIEWWVSTGTSREKSGTVASGTGDRISFNYDKSGALYVYAKAVRSDIEEPSDKDYVLGRTFALYKSIKKPKVVMIGPRVVETDYVQTFNAQVFTDFDGSNTNLKTSGEWTLPDGQIIPGNVLNWMPDKSDKQLSTDEKVKISYTAWVDGYKEETKTTVTKTLGIWTYIWPDFTMKATLSKNVAPTTASLVVTPDDLESFRKIDSKDITYTWSIDPDLILNRVIGGTARLTVPNGGTFNAGVTISDKRGNETTLEVPITSADAADILIKLNVKNASRYLHAPLDVFLTSDVTGGVNGDFIKTIVYDIDGTPLDFANKTFGKVVGVGVGKHKVGVNITTNFGRVGTQSAEFDVPENIPPTCELKVTPIDNLDNYLEVSCNDPDGRIKTYEWTVDNVNLGARSYRWRYKKPTERANIPLSVVVTDDGDAKVKLNSVVP